jgi:hypothetical protein
MPRDYFLLLSSLLISPAVITPPHATAATVPTTVIAQTAGPLTIAEAKTVVARSLLATGQRMVRVGSAEFDGQGNVVVQLTTQEGLPFRHVVVDGRTHALVAARDRHALNG